MAASPRVGRFFPLVKAVPSTNGNGHHPAPATEAKGVTVDSRIVTQFVPLNGNGDTVRTSTAALDWYAVSWLAYTCMRYRATKLVEAPLWIAEEKDGEESWLEGDHPLAEILERPNPDMEMADLLELTSLYLDSTGAALWVKSRDRGDRVGALYPFSGEDFRVETADVQVRGGGTQRRLHGKFRVKTTRGEKEYGPNDVVYFRNASPADPHGAVAPLHAALARLGIDRTLIESIQAGLRNAVVPGMMLEFPPAMNLTQEQIDDLQARVAAKYADAKNHGKFFASNARARQGVMGFEGLNGGELGKEIEAAVCACFQLPPVVVGAFVGLVNSSDRHNLETSVGLVYDNAIIPTWSRIEKALTRGLLREVDPNPLRFIRFDRSKVKALQEDLGAKAEMVERLRQELDVDERRALLGYPATTPKQRESLKPRPAVRSAEEEEREDEAEDEGKSRTPAERKAISEDDLRRALFDESTRSQELGWQMEAAALLDADRAAVLALAERTLRTGQKDDDPFAPADAGSVRELIREIAEHMDLESATRWRSRMEPLVGATGRRAVERLSTELGIAFDLLQPGLFEYTQREAAWLVTEVTETTKREIRDALAAGLAEGESIPKLTARLQESGTFARSRAELIARTETTRVTNGGQRESLAAYAAETGDRITKRWLATLDARTRDAHRDMDGEEAAIDEAFSNGLMAPGEPNCRCTLVYAMESA